MSDDVVFAAVAKRTGNGNIEVRLTMNCTGPEAVHCLGVVQSCAVLQLSQGAAMEKTCLAEMAFASTTLLTGLFEIAMTDCVQKLLSSVKSAEECTEILQSVEMASSKIVGEREKLVSKLLGFATLKVNSETKLQ